MTTFYRIDPSHPSSDIKENILFFMRASPITLSIIDIFVIFSQRIVVLPSVKFVSVFFLNINNLFENSFYFYFMDIVVLPTCMSV